MAEPAPIRFGIMGCADIVRKVSRAMLLAPNSTIVALGSRSLDKATIFAKENGFPDTVKVYGSYDAVLEDEKVDAVYIPLPTCLHMHWAVRAAQKKKHVLLEKPVALNVKELDVILAACESSGVQFMDSSMWMHHPRTAKMMEFMSDYHQFGQLKMVHSNASFSGSPDFLKSNIRVKPDLDSLGALGDLGWYCIGAILWAYAYDLPKTVTAIPEPEVNEAGVILSCGASMKWEGGRIATFYCSFLATTTMDITALGTNGILRVYDFIIPWRGTNNGASFSYSRANNPVTSEEMVASGHPQEALMVKEFCGLVDGIRRDGLSPEKKRGEICRKTQVVLDAVKTSIEKGFDAIEIVF